MKKSLNDVAELKRFVEQTHGCAASYRTTIAVEERSKGETVWDGSVIVFDVFHPEAQICYAWTSQAGDADKLRSYAVLGKPPINSPADAVRAAIVADSKDGRTT